MVTCTLNINTRRRRFWTTQLCPDTDYCGDPCNAAGLKLETPDGATGNQRSFKTDGFVTSLAINILLTDARHPDSTCGRRPGSMGGHWADSFRNNAVTSGGSLGSGSLLRQVPVTSRISDAIQLIKTYATRDLQKLVVYKLANEIEVTTEYVGNNNVKMQVKITGFNGETELVALSGTRSPNEWLWSRS